MSPCEKYLEMISAMIDGQLDDTDRAELMAHVLECDNCRRALDAFSAIAEDMKQLAPVPEGFAAGVMGSIGKPKKKIIHWQRYAAMAACLVLVCVAGLRALPGHEGKVTAMGSMKSAVFTSAAQEAEAPGNAAPQASVPESAAAKMPEPMPEAECAPAEQIMDQAGSSFEYVSEPVSDADYTMEAVDGVVLNSLNFTQLSLNSRGESYEATGDEAKYLLSNLNYGHEAEVPAYVPDHTIELATGEIVELWETEDGFICRIDGLTFAPAGQSEVISDIIQDMTE